MFSSKWRYENVPLPKQCQILVTKIFSGKTLEANIEKTKIVFLYFFQVNRLKYAI
jgi:hypothetical protein